MSYTKIMFLPYGASKGCRALRKELRGVGLPVKRIKRVGSAYRGYNSHLIVNWGKTTRGFIREGINILNNPIAVARASDKVVCLKALKDAEMGNNIPRFCTTFEEARVFIEEGEVVYCRTLSRGSQGRGIVIATTVEELVPAPLYTCKVDVSREVRVHVFQGEVLHKAQKRKLGAERREEEGILEVDEDIRSHHNGWIFSIRDVDIPEEALSAAVGAVNALGLDFGAVDMALTSQEGCKIYEVNSAPGLEGTTLERYRDAISNLYRA